VPLLGLVVGLTPAAAQHIHRWVDAQGNVRYSGSPPQPGAAAQSPAALPGSAAGDGFAPIREKPASADEMLELSGVRAQLPDLMRDLVGEIVRSRPELNERERSAMRVTVERAFDASRIHVLVRDEYARRSPPDSRAAAASWYRSPAGRRFVELARLGARQADPATLTAFAAALERRPPSPGRLELIERYDWASGTSETAADLVLAVQRGLARGMVRATPGEPRLRPGQIDAETQERRPALATAIRERVRVRLLHTFRDLTDEDLRQFVQFEASPEGRAHGRAVHQALTHALAIAAERAGLDLARARARPTVPQAAR
jgi:hypothetical protein